MLSEHKILLVKIESPYGSDPTPTGAANFLAASNISVRPNLTYNDTAATDGSLSPRAGTLGQKYIEVTFDYELQMEIASDYKTPPCDPLLLSTGYTDSVADGIYLPRTTGFQSCTLWVYEEDILWKVNGCRGNVDFNFAAGKPVMLSFTMQGLYTKPVDSTFLTSWTELGSSPVVAMNQSFDWDTSNHPVVESLAFGLKNTLAQNPSLDDADTHGISEIVITNRMPEGSFNPEMIKAGTIDYLTAYESVLQKPISYVVSDGTSKLTVSLPKTELMSFASGDRGGTLIYDLPFRCVRTTGDDEISLAFAAV